MEDNSSNDLLQEQVQDESTELAVPETKRSVPKNKIPLFHLELKYAYLATIETGVKLSCSLFYLFPR